MNVKFKASARTTALHRTGAGRQRNPTAPVGGEVFSLDIPFHRTRMIKIRKTNLECAVESTTSRFGRAGADLSFQVCAHCQVHSMPQLHRESCKVRRGNENSQNEPGMCLGINSFTFGVALHRRG